MPAIAFEVTRNTRAVAARGDQHGLGVDGVQLAGLDLVGNHAAAFAIAGEEQVDQVELVEEVDPVLDALLVQGLDDHVTGAVSRVAGPTDRSLSEVAGVAAEESLVDLALFGPVERQAHVLQLEHGVDRLAGPGPRRCPGRRGSRRP